MAVATAALLASRVGPTKRTCARSVARLTETSFTPGTALIAFSTRATQEAHVIPEMPRSADQSPEPVSGLGRSFGRTTVIDTGHAFLANQ